MSSSPAALPILISLVAASTSTLVIFHCFNHQYRSQSIDLETVESNMLFNWDMHFVRVVAIN